jgi:hypothetical protein
MPIPTTIPYSIGRTRHAINVPNPGIRSLSALLKKNKKVIQ